MVNRAGRIASDAVRGLPPYSRWPAVELHVILGTSGSGINKRQADQNINEKKRMEGMRAIKLQG